MATDRTTILIDADASGVKTGVQQAEQAIGGLGSAVDRQGKRLNLYGERLSKTFGKNQGLHGRLDSLEMPLRDVEGSFARVEMATRAFGNAGASATDKVSAGFLLAGDSVAAFVSGGVLGLAISGVVALGAVIVDKMGSGSKAIKEAAEELKKLADAAVAAGVTISSALSDTAEKTAAATARSAEEQVRQSKITMRDLQDEIDKANAERSATRKVGVMRAARLRAKAFTKQLEAAKIQHKKIKRASHYANLDLTEAAQTADAERLRSAQTTTSKIVDAIKAQREAQKKAIGGGPAARTAKTAAPGDTSEAEAAAALKRLDDLEQQLFEGREAARARNVAQRDQWAEDDRAARFARFSEEVAAAEKSAAAQQTIAKEAEDTKKALMGAALSALTNNLFAMAQAGEFSAQKLAESVLKATAQMLVSKGTYYLLDGLVEPNPVKVTIGGKMIAAGLTMGLAGGALMGAGAAPAASSTPTDTRASRTAATTSDGGGGPTIINFNGPAFDKRGVSQVITSGQRMARHRRVQGA